MLRTPFVSGGAAAGEEALRLRIEPLRAELLRHPIYGRVNDLPSLRLFMASHVWAVWDFMTLAKALQRSLTCVETPWLPPRDRRAARLINSIVLGEESDEIAPGQYASHFDLYLAAMAEVGADRAPIAALVSALRSGQPVGAALAEATIPRATREFVWTTLRTAGEGRVHEVAASFLHGREDLVPVMFRRILATLEVAGALVCPSFRCYLDRHVHVDEGEHAPMAAELLRSLCGEDEVKWKQAAEAAAVALTARRALWDGVFDQIGQRAEPRPARAAERLAFPVPEI
jgi:hypothetical protein